MQLLLQVARKVKGAQTISVQVKPRPDLGVPQTPLRSARSFTIGFTTRRRFLSKSSQGQIWGPPHPQTRSSKNLLGGFLEGAHSVLQPLLQNTHFPPGEGRSTRVLKKLKLLQVEHKRADLRIIPTILLKALCKATLC